ncbi:hypothetical protein Ga0074812_13056 [Parafrankia irregularis]|uniref:Uncharacterized protein n=2 Tax=Parafrankia irregularis TaxID=795642 RepID=A0A0S4QXR4_9ACTN|nr:hypothetical protein [Parafrankia sp. CH37]CUU59676.1 hypothetical protein Ga0074812_13056 [Parafrankia irregularis]
MSNKGRSQVTLRRGLIIATGAAMVVGTTSIETSAAPGQTSPPQSTTAQVVVGSAITLTGLPASFALSGNPGDTVATTTPVTMTVLTNNFEGYTVSVSPQTATLNPPAPTNTDTIPISSLQVRPTGSGAFTPLAFGTPVVVESHASPSAELGDSVSHDYQITIPFVRPDTYSAVLDYVATTL